MAEKAPAFTPLEEKILRLQSLKEYIEYINDPHADYFSIVVNASHFLYQSYRNAVNIFVIDLCKLLNNKENDNLPVFLGRLLSNHETLSWKHPISKETLRGVQKRLKQVVNGDMYNKAKSLRNMHIAHDDINKVQFDLVVKLDDLWFILKEVKEIYNTLNFHLNNNQIHFEEITNYGELQNLEKFSKLKKRIYSAHINNENSIDTQELLKILRNLK